MSAQRPVPRPAVTLVVAALAALAALAPGAPAGAQEDPYGSTTTTTEAPPDPTCDLVEAQVEVGGTVTGEIVGAPVGELLQITFGGEVLAEVEVGDDGTADLSVVIPDAGSGAGALVVVGATVNLACALDLTGVLGGQAERPPGAPNRGAGGGGDVSSGGVDAPGSGGTAAGGTEGSGSGSGSGSGVLARTGENLPLLIAVGLALLVAGAVLVRRARPRPTR